MAGPIVTNDGMTPADVEAYARQVEAQHGFRSGGLVAMLKQESRLGLSQQAHAPSENSHAAGVAQIQPGTAALLAKQGYPVDVYSGKSSIDGMAHLMDASLASNGGNWDNAVQQYWAGSQKGVNAHPGGASAYGKAVASQLSIADAADQATDWTGQGGRGSPFAAPPSAAPAAAPPPPDAPEKTLDQAANEATFGAHDASAAPTGGTDTTNTTSDAPADPYVDLKAGMQNILNHGGSPDDVARFVRNSGYDPAQFENLATNAKTGQIQFGQPFNPTKLDPSVMDNLQTGAVQGVADVTGSLNQFAGWADKQVPALGQLDGLVGMTPQAFANTNAINMASRNAYDHNVGGFAAGAGRLGGNLLASAPFMAAGGGLAAAALPEGAGAAILGGNKLAQLASANALAGAGGNALTSSASSDPLSTQMERGGITGAIAGPVIGKVANGIGSMIAPAIDPLSAQVADAAAKLGVRVPTWALDRSSLGQAVSGAAKYLPGSGIADDAARYQQELAGAAAKTIGEPDFSQQSILNFKSRAKDAYQNTGAGIPLRVDPATGGHPLLENLGALETQANLDSVQKPRWDKWTQHLQDQIGPDGTIPHDAYRSLVQKGSMLDNMRGSDNRDIASLATAARNELKNARRLDLSPEDQAKIDTMDAQYRNWAALRGTINPTDGTTTPAKLSRAATNADPNRLATGGGDLGTVADAAHLFKNTEGMSPTAPRNKLLDLALNGAVSIPTAALGALGLAHTGVDAGALGNLAMEGGAGLAGAYGVGKGVGAFLRSPGRGNLILQKALNNNPSAFRPLNLLPPAAVFGLNRLQAKSAPAR